MVDILCGDRYGVYSITEHVKYDCCTYIFHHFLIDKTSPRWHVLRVVLVTHASTFTIAFIDTFSCRMDTVVNMTHLKRCVNAVYSPLNLLSVSKL